MRIRSSKAQTLKSLLSADAIALVLPYTGQKRVVSNYSVELK